jgi:rod shape-determining protein MreC
MTVLPQLKTDLLAVSERVLPRTEGRPDRGRGRLRASAPVLLSLAIVIAVAAAALTLSRHGPAVSRSSRTSATAKDTQSQIEHLRRELRLAHVLRIAGYHPVTAEVVLRAPTLWYETVDIDKGSIGGVALHDPVLAGGALVGEVSEVSQNASLVSLITDHTMSVTARVTDANGDTGELGPATTSPNHLVLQYLQAPNPGQLRRGPQPGQLVVTAGFRSAALESYFPASIPIGWVAPFNENDLLNNGQVPVTPAADLRHFDVVQILTRP